ncbi:MAG: hypothetical protein J1D88_09550 [Treponema sp.]|nr:hypothetical protein [Treponema sp.]
MEERLAKLEQTSRIAGADKIKLLEDRLQKLEGQNNALRAVNDRLKKELESYKSADSFRIEDTIEK